MCDHDQFDDEDAFGEWLMLEASGYAKKFAGMLRGKGVKVSAADQDDFSGEFMCGAMEAYNGGCREPIEISARGKRKVFAFREWCREWTKVELGFEDFEGEEDAGKTPATSIDSEVGGSDFLNALAGENPEFRQMLQADILREMVEAYPSGQEKRILQALCCGLDGTRQPFDDAEAAAHFSMSLPDFKEAAREACIHLVEAMKEAIRAAPPRPSATSDTPSPAE